ncbi:MAG: late competence development ComFB family protein [Defluviitaleaceae bacterium]|nr:late competence development ComFB family protein [Defluviitaleaceae bacterium]
MSMNRGRRVVLSEENLEIRNYMQNLVLDQLENVLDSLNACQCENCLHDILAISLNNLPAKYVVTKKSELYSKLANLQAQYDVDVVAAIAQASAIVSRAPRHDRI